jgi:hypothetical protein
VATNNTITTHANSPARPDPAPISTEVTTLTIHPWIDPLVDDVGHDPRSCYVEQFWLGILGPTATWLLRRLVTTLERHPEGCELDLGATASAMGLSFTVGRSSPFSKALQRIVMFGLAHPLPGGALAIRTSVPPVGHRHLRRMPEAVQRSHEEWITRLPASEDFARAHHIGQAMIDAGDEPSMIEHQLRSLHVNSTIAAQVAENFTRLASDATSP